MIAIVAILCLTFCRGREVEFLDQEVGQKIFHEDSDYLIYVDSDFEKLNPQFQQYCKESRHGCAYINSNADEFEMFYRFMGVQEPRYYLFVNPQQRRKFVMESQPTKQNFKEFYEDYRDGELKPYFASEPEPIQKNPYSSQIVGKTFENFTRFPNRVNIMFFYVDQEHCYECSDAFKAFLKIAEKLKSDRVAFGQMNLMSNEHQLIEQSNVPSVVIYTSAGQQKVIEKFVNQDLESLISENIKNISISQEL